MQKVTYKIKTNKNLEHQIRVLWQEKDLLLTKLQLPLARGKCTRVIRFTLANKYSDETEEFLRDVNNVNCLLSIDALQYSNKLTFENYAGRRMIKISRGVIPINAIAYFLNFDKHLDNLSWHTDYSSKALQNTKLIKLSEKGIV